MIKLLFIQQQDAKIRFEIQDQPVIDLMLLNLRLMLNVLRCFPRSFADGSLSSVAAIAFVLSDLRPKQLVRLKFHVF